MKRTDSLELFLLRFESLATRKAYKIDIEQFYDFMSSTFEKIKSLDRVNLYHAESFVKKLKNEKWASRTINRKIASNLSFFEFLIEKNEIVENVWNQIGRMDNNVVYPVTSVGHDDVQKLLDAIEGNEEVSLLHQAILFTLFTTGMKKGELINLKIKDFEDEDGVYFIRIENKGSSTRIKINNKCARRISRYLDELILSDYELNPSDWLFRPSKNPLDTSDLNKPMNPKSVDYVIKRWCNEAGLGTKISSHSARKICLESAIEKKPSSPIIQEKFGISQRTYSYYKKSSAEGEFLH